MDALEASIRGKDVVDEDTMRVIEEKFESLVPYYQSAKNTGLTFINESARVSVFVHPVHFQYIGSFKSCQLVSQI